MSITHSPDSIRRQDIPFIIFFFPYPQTSQIFLSPSFSSLSAFLSLSHSLHSYWFKSHLAIQLRISKLNFFCKPCIVQNMKTIIDAFPVLVLSYSSFMFIISGKSYFLNAHPYTYTNKHKHTHI